MPAAQVAYVATPNADCVRAVVWHHVAPHFTDRAFDGVGGVGHVHLGDAESICSIGTPPNEHAQSS